MAGTSAPNVLSTFAPPVSPERAGKIAREHFAITATATPLIGERDSNFRLSAADGTSYLLKLVNPAEDVLVTDFQTGALQHIAARDPSLPVPRVVPSINGEAYFKLNEAGEPARIVRLLTYLDGTPLAGVARSPLLRRELGAGLARLDLALAGYEHPGSGHELLWDLSHAAKLRPMIVHVEDDARRAMAGRVLDRVETGVLTQLGGLRRQVIHNDFNPSNVLVAPGPEGSMSRLAGVIDFGDMVKAALINEVAVGASYHIGGDEAFLEPVMEFVAGYHAELPLQEREIDRLFEVILTRMLLTVIISSWRSSLEPGNRDYIQRNAERAWGGLARAQALSRGQAADALHRHLRKETAP